MLGCTWANLAHSIHTPMLAQMETNIQVEMEVIRKTLGHCNQLKHAQCDWKRGWGDAQPISPIRK